MENIMRIIIIILFSILLISCEKDDSMLSEYIFEEYQSKLRDEGYTIDALTDSNNVSRWLEISSDDLVSIHRASSEERDDVLYFYLFPTTKKANKWHNKFVARTEDTNYEVFLDGHFVIVVLGNESFEIAEDISG